MKRNVKFISISAASMISIALAGLVVFSCGEESKDENKATDSSPTTTSAIKYSEVSSSITEYCLDSGCHGKTTPGSIYDMTTQANIAKNATLAALRIEQGSMPTGINKTNLDKDSATKSKLIEWLKAGAPE